ncbi:uncharacterized protein LOC111267255 isoform X2 [Varroa jacobsoni]|nr:uncharacterized protein LOC111267255 isoform X2 [Varroa jacobsoni]XP_022701106.1 uncharacterized protein LOC111267255 isoform X2 [Varroa jacobsoni]
MPPPASAQGTQVTLGEEMNDFIEAEGEAVTEVGTFERESNTENKDQQESREEGVDIEITDNLDNAKVNNAEGGAATSQSGEAETTTMAIAEMRTNEIGSIDTERRWKLDNIRRRLMFLKRRGIF